MKKYGYIGIVGSPNVGKSTLLNYILQYKISITTRKPHTTRYSIMGIKIYDNYQCIYFDTPGMHYTNKINVLHTFMNNQSDIVINFADIILFVVAYGKYSDHDQYVLNRILKNNNIPIILVINKVDKLSKIQSIVIDNFCNFVIAKYNFYSVFLVSAKHGHCINKLENKIFSLLNRQGFLYSKNKCNVDKKFIISEIIREKLIRNLGCEVPYLTMVNVEYYKHNVSTNVTLIDAAILIKRNSHKHIIIGKKGSKIKQIGIYARHDIEYLLSNKVMLTLWVKLEKHWFSKLTEYNMHHNITNIN